MGKSRLNTTPPKLTAQADVDLSVIVVLAVCLHVLIGIYILHRMSCVLKIVTMLASWRYL